MPEETPNKNTSEAPSLLMTTMIPSLTPTPKIFYLSPSVDYKEINYESKFSDNFNGSLIYQRIDDEFSYYLLNLSSFESKQILGINSESAFISVHPKSISPNQAVLIFFELIDPDKYIFNLRAITSDGSIVNTSSLPEKLGGFVGWFDNEKVLLTEKNQSGVMHIYNIFTGKDQKIQSDWLNLGENELLWIMSCKDQGGLYSFISYNLDLDRAVYKTRKNDEESTYYYYDLLTQKIIWNARVSYSSEPIWSPDGDVFSIMFRRKDQNTGNLEGSLFTIDRNGDATRLTDNVAGCQSWSPNGRNIATWWRGETEFESLISNDDYLLIYDLENEKMTVYNIQFPSAIQYPIWSPDGNMIAVSIFQGYSESNHEPNYDIIIVDLLDNTAYPIIQNAFVLGWLDNSK